MGDYNPYRGSYGWGNNPHNNSYRPRDRNGAGGGGGGGGGAGGGGGGLGSGLGSVDWARESERSDWVPNAAIEKVKEAEAVVKHNGLDPAAATQWREEHKVSIFGEHCPGPMPRFEMLTILPPFIQRRFQVQGFTEPTPIQAQSWPILFQHRDFVGIAKTGSGKTLAFIVPAIAHIAVQQQLRQGDGPLVIVLAPTRELAQQIETETQKVLPNTMRCACIFGGTPKGPQISMVRGGVHILVATPGRLIDLLQIGVTNLRRTTYLVLDEADRMLDMGFEPQVRSICSQIRPDRQTLMFSATWPREIQNLAQSFLRKFIRIHIGSTELHANPDVTQHFLQVSEYDKINELRRILDENRHRRVLVFCKMKRTTDELERRLRSFGFEVYAIHGDKEQRQRDYILDRFRRDDRCVLIATDVAARGLDIKELEIVVNFDFPMQIDDYVHRIGRTGRAGAKGDAYTFISGSEPQFTHSVADQLVKLLEKGKQDVPSFLRECGGRGAKRQREGFGSGHGFHRQGAGHKNYDYDRSRYGPPRERTFRGGW